MLFVVKWLFPLVCALTVLVFGAHASVFLANRASDAAVFGGAAVLLLTIGLFVSFGTWYVKRIQAALRMRDAVRRFKDTTPRMIALVALLVLASAAGACARIGPGHVGIVVSMAGTNRGVEDTPETTGWVFYNPALTRVFEFPTFVQTAKWTKSATEGKPVNEEITFTNSEGVLFGVDVSLSYHLVQGKVPAFYVKFRTDDLDLFTHGFLRNLARDKFDTLAGKYNTAQIMGDNGPFLAAARKSLDDDLAPMGVQLDQFGLIGAPRPPDGIQSAINLKAQAAQIAQQKENELRQIQADAAKEVAKAEGHAKAVLAAADAEATSNRKIAESITPNLLQLKQLERWNGALPQVNGSGVAPFVTLDAKK